MVCDVDFRFPDATRTHTVEVARGFANQGFEVDLVARGPDPHTPGVRYSRAHGSEYQRVVRLATINLATIRLLLARRRTAELFYVRDSWTCIPALAAARLLGYRIVSQVDGITFRDVNGHELAPLNRVKRLLSIAMGRLAHGVLAVTPEIKQLLVDQAHIPTERIRVIPNGVDLEFFHPLPRAEAIERAQLDPACRYVVFCGGFHPWSDFDLLIESFSLVAEQRPEARLLLVGDGSERERIDELARRFGVQDKVTITGLVHDRSRVRDYLGAATLTVLAYRCDEVNRTSASPIKLTEYLASGRAVLAVDIPGIREILEETGAGVVLPGGGGPGPMAQAMVELLDPERADAFGACGRRMAEERLSWQSVVTRTLPLFEL